MTSHAQRRVGPRHESGPTVTRPGLSVDVNRRRQFRCTSKTPVRSSVAAGSSAGHRPCRHQSGTTASGSQLLPTATLAAVSFPSRVALDAMVAEATVDCYSDSECVTGFYTMLDDHLDVPFQTVVLGVEVTVTGVELTGDEQIVAVCVRDGSRQRIPILDLPLPTPWPAGAGWIDAYDRWLG
jgi:hypothetical protein